MLNTKCHVAEATSANAFWVRDGVLYTPSLDSGILAGVTRGVVLEIAREQGIEVVEGHFAFEELLAAEEAFLTSSTWELAPVRSIDDMTFAEAPGEMTKRLAEEYTQRVMSDSNA
jgi:branched-subunit amino acid aminotransferase/4-amino-4-deoxychorismate lyase